MAKISNLFREKVYTIARSSEIFKNEKEIINFIFKKFETEIKSVNFIDANERNDLFKIKDVDGLESYIKLSLEENPNFFIEADILARNFKKNISPRLIDAGYVESYGNISYSLTSSIPTQNIKEYGVATIVNNPQLISNLFLQLSKFNFDGIKIQSIYDYLEKYLSFDITKISKINLSSPEANPLIKELIQNQTVNLKNILTEKLKHINFDETVFCHGNLNQSTILGFEDSLCCINFENAYIGDILFEILNLRYQLFYDQTTESKIIELFHKKTKQKLNLVHLKKYREFVNYWNLYKTCVDYLNEVFVLNSKRMNKILDLAFCLSKNYENFYGLPDFEKNFKPIAELFVESVI